jgi:hypothetical protein
MSGALTWARLSYRQQRWELLLVLLAVAGAAAAMVWAASTLDAMRAASPECLAGVGGGFVGSYPEGEPAATCQGIIGDYYGTESLATTLIDLAWVAPFALGVILGAPLVAREIDGGTAQLAWSLSRSRSGWLLRRIAFMAIVGLTLLAVLAFTSELLAAAILPDHALDADFVWFGRRGWPIVARGAGAMMLGVLVGAIIGRVLPAVLASAVVIGIAFTGLSLAHDQWNRAEATLERRILDAAQPSEAEITGLGVAYGIETVDGEFLSYSEAYDHGLNATYTGADGKVYPSEADIAAGRFIGHEAMLIIAGERYPELVARESAVAGGVGLVALGTAALVVRRRRPV